MEWVQVLTIIAATVSSLFVFYQLTNERISRLEVFHREDMKAHKDEMNQRFTQSDERWERLFEKLITKDQGK
jgi:hypothetical protein